MTTSSPAAKPAKQKPKSPPAPSWSLKDSFNDAQKLYKDYSHGSFSKEEIASKLEVSVSSGPFAARLYTLKEYGLLERSDGNLKVSQSFMTLHSAPQGSAAFKTAALAAVKRSTVFAELLDAFRGKLPPKDAVAQRLETQKQFNSSRAKEVAAVLEDSLKYAGLLDQNNNILPIREGGGGTPDPRRDQGHDTSQDAPGGPPSGTPPPGEPAKQVEGSLRTEIPLKEGRKVVVYYPPDFSAEQAEKVGTVLKAIAG
jgi:hypothetical protein